MWFILYQILCIFKNKIPIKFLQDHVHNKDRRTPLSLSWIQIILKTSRSLGEIFIALINFFITPVLSCKMYQYLIIFQKKYFKDQRIEDILYISHIVYSFFFHSVSNSAPLLKLKSPIKFPHHNAHRKPQRAPLILTWAYIVLKNYSRNLPSLFLNKTFIFVVIDILLYFKIYQERIFKIFFFLKIHAEENT